MSRTYEPENYEEAVHSKESKKWKQAMEEEMQSLKKNGTWILVPKPGKQKLIKCKWLYNLKEGMTSFDPIGYKAR